MVGDRGAIENMPAEAHPALRPTIRCAPHDAKAIRLLERANAPQLSRRHFQMQTTLIRRFSASNQVTHFLYAIAWIVLGIALRRRRPARRGASGLCGRGESPLRADALRNFPTRPPFPCLAEVLGRLSAEASRPSARPPLRSPAGALQRRSTRGLRGADRRQLHARRIRLGSFPDA